MRGIMDGQSRALLLALAVAAATVLGACDARPALSFAPDALPDGTVGQPYSATITVTNSQTPVGDFFVESGLPPGLALAWDENGDRDAAQLAGTPTAAGTYRMTVSAWCLGTNVSGQTGSREYTLVVR